MEDVAIVWNAHRREYGYRFTGRITWCASHADAVALARLVAKRNGTGVSDGTPRGYRDVEALYGV